MRSLLVCQNGTFLRDQPLDAISDYLEQPNTLLWLDITDPNEADAELLREEFGVHPLAIEDTFNETHRPKIDRYADHYFMIFYAAQLSGTPPTVEVQALHLIVGRNYLVSVHRGAMRQVDETLVRWQHPHGPLSNQVGALLYALLDTVVDDYFPVIDDLAEQIEDVQDQIFTAFREESIQTIFALKRELLALRRVMAPQRDVMNVLLRREVPIFSSEDTVYLQDVYDHIVRVLESTENYRDLLGSALDSYLSLQSNRLNQIVKVLTITSIILMSDALIAGIYGMNFQFMPELAWPFGYPFALGMMVLVSGGLLLLFRRLKWL